MTVTNILSDVASVNRLLWQRLLTNNKTVVPCHFAFDVTEVSDILNDAWEEAFTKLLQDARTGLNDAQTITARLKLRGKSIKVVGKIFYEGNQTINPYCRRNVKLALENEL
jgi:hypothetical protein